jgi:L-methionine (R)-S-oxide reductase
LKASTARLNRVQAKEVLVKVDSALAAARGHEARDSVVRILNQSVPSYTWVGIYLVEGKDLVLDAWSGPSPTEHERIPIGKGVCGYAAKSGKTEIVSDVSKDSRYLQCFLSTKSEMVVPMTVQGKVVGEIDIDSDQLDAFSSIDGEFLEAVARKIAQV